jgi:hypothetical protein
LQKTIKTIMKSIATAAILSLALLSGVKADDHKCPSSPAFVHAWAEVTVDVSNYNCSVVLDEMKARISGQYDAWHDPHNNGTYVLDSSSDGELDIHRTTGNKKYTDKIIFTASGTSNSCTLKGCSQSQVTSVSDFSTNYCNMRMLYCGKADGCQPVLSDLKFSESITKSVGASDDKSACLQV